MDYAVSDGEMLKFGSEMPGDMDIDVTLIDCGSSCDVRGSPGEAEDEHFTAIVSERAEVPDMSASTLPKKRGRRPKSDLPDLGAADDPTAYELKQGYRILRELMSNNSKSVNTLFMNYPVNDSEDPQYREKIASPMWLTQMQDKFKNREYPSITYFVKDFRLMLENCYRFNGPDHYVSKKAQKLEHMFEVKLRLLSREVRVKTTFEAISGLAGIDSSGASVQSAADDGNTKEALDSESPAGRRIRRAPVTPLPCAGSLGALDGSSSSALLNRLREEERERERDNRRRQQEDRRKDLELQIQELQLWERNFIDEQTKREMHSMWELPQIGHFLCLFRGPLSITEVSQHELERILLMPIESITLSTLMTSLLSTPQQRIRMRNHAPMPFAVWEAKLRTRLDAWYKAADVAAACGSSVDEQLGIDNRFFGIVGHQNPLPRKSFADLFYLQKVWILKALCEHCMHTQEAVREAIDLLPADEARESILGVDADGRTYLHFPQFRNTDVRVYRLAAVPTRALDRLPAEKASGRKRTGSKAAKTALQTLGAESADLEVDVQQVHGKCVPRNLGTDRTSCASPRSERLSKRAQVASDESRLKNLPCAPVRRSARNRLRQSEVGSTPNDQEHSINDDLPPADCTGSPDRPAAAASNVTETSGSTSAEADAVNGRILISSCEREAAADPSGSSSTQSLQTLADSGTVARSDDESKQCRSDPGCSREDGDALQLTLNKQSSCAPENDSPSKSTIGTPGDDPSLVVSVNEFETFQLVASSVAELRNLIRTLSLPCSSSNDAETSGAEVSVNATPDEKLPGEIELRGNLQMLLKDLEPSECRLESSRRRVTDKLRREKVMYKPPPPLTADDKVLLEWDAEEDEMAGKKREQRLGSATEAGSDDGSESKDCAASDSTATPATSTKHGADSCEAAGAMQPLPGLKEGESWDVSSFGRLRKRRIIPNNVEDSGMPRKRPSTAPAQADGGASIATDSSAAPADAYLVAKGADSLDISCGARGEIKPANRGSSEEDCTIVSQSAAELSSEASIGTRVFSQATPGASSSAVQISAAASNSGSYNLISVDGKIYMMPSSHVASLLGDSAAAASRSSVVFGGSSSVSDAAKIAAQPIDSALRSISVMSGAALQSAEQRSRTTLLHAGASPAGGTVALPLATLRSGATMPDVPSQQLASTILSWSRSAMVGAAPAAAVQAIMPAQSLTNGMQPVVTRLNGLSSSGFAYQPIFQPSGGSTRLVLGTVAGTGQALGSPSSASSHVAVAQPYIRTTAPAANHVIGTYFAASVSQASAQQQAAAISAPAGGALLPRVIGGHPTGQHRPDQRLLLTYTPSPSHGRLQAAAAAGRALTTGAGPANVVQCAPGSAVTRLCLADPMQQHGRASAQLFVYQPQQQLSSAARLPVARVSPTVAYTRTSVPGSGGPLLIAAAPQQQQQQLLLLNLPGGQLVQPLQQQQQQVQVLLVDERALVGSIQLQQQPAPSNAGPDQAAEVLLPPR